MAEQHEKALVPQIRFTGFTDPWEQRKLGEVAYGFEYGLNAAASDFDGEKKYLRITDIDDQTREFRTDDLSSPDINNPIDDKYLLKEGDILFARTGASVGKTYLYKASDGKTYYAGFLIRAHVSDEADAGFIFQSTLTERYKQFVLLTSQRSGQPGINAQEYADFLLPLPSLSEQRRIGKFFSRLDSLITLHQRKYDKLCVLKKSMLDKMFPKGGSLYPEIRFAGFTDPWEQRKLGELTEIKDSARIPNRLWREAGVPYIRASDISQEDLRGELFIDEEDYAAYKAATGAPEKGDVLFNGGGEIGKAIINGNSSPIYVQGGAVLYARIAHSSLLDARYLVAAFVTQNVVNAIGVLSAGGTMKHFTLQPAKNLPIEVPSIAEQRRIGAFFDRLDSLITLHQRKLELLRNIKKSMLDKMFV